MLLGVVVDDVGVVVVEVGVVVVLVGVVVVLVGVVLVELDDELLREEELELLDEDELELLEVLDVDGTVVAIDGVPPEILPGGGSGTIGWPWRAPCMKAVQIERGTVPPVISAYPPRLTSWFSGLSDPSPR